MTIRIELLDIRARQLLEDLANMDLIRIHEDQNSKEELTNLLRRFRLNSETTPSLSEISDEVELVRKDRYERNE